MNIDKIRNLKIYQLLIGVKHYIEYLFASFLLKTIKMDKYNIIDDEKTVDLIVNQKKSISRFGDGEFKWLIGMKQNNFQDDNEQMKKKLSDVLLKKNENLIIGIPSFINDCTKFTVNSKRYWKMFLFKSYNKFKKYLNLNIEYCDSYITRPYLDIKNKNRIDVEKRFKNLQRIWDGKEIVIVEGTFSRLGLGNDLFDCAKKIERIICPPKNAFNKYSEIANTIRKNGKEKIYILSLGPTATILAYELSLENYQCIDLGHIDIEYMWFKNGCKRKTKINGKYVNEVDNNGIIVDITNEEYQKQIIKKIDI